MSEDLIRALVTIAFGALAGGLTNTIAIWMLFHPYHPPRVGGVRFGWLQGAVPKNQARLAAAIGRTVGGKLLTADDLTRIFAETEFRAAFDERLAAFLDDVLHQERPSLRDLLPPEVAPEVERLVESLLEHSLERLDGYLASDSFDRAMRDRTEGIVAAVADEPISGLLTPAREVAVAEAVESWLVSAVEGPDFRSALDDYLARGADSLLEPERTFEEILPLGLVGSLERAVGGYLPLAIERLGSLLDDPVARAKFERTLRELFQRFLGDLKFHQRVVARLVVTEDTVDRVLDTIQEEGAERLSEMLREPAIQEAMAKGVNEAIVDFLRRPVRSILGPPDSASVVDARETLAEWLVNVARDAQTRSFVVEKLQQGLDKAGARTWGDILERIPPDRISEWLITAGRSEPVRTIARDLAGRLADTALSRPIGTPARWLPEDAPSRLERGLGPVLWDWLQGQVPTVIQRLDVGRRVEDKVMEFPMPKLEALVRRVTDRELRLIVRLGYLLGAIIGTGLVAIDRLWG
ncbi:MAG: DUF445 family protein [Gemmatimonadetes bacterium]|nr:DUF445 family protein [Gemmatimonadota bacterium]